MRIIYKILFFQLLLTGCFKTEIPKLDNMEFYEGYTFYSISASALRIRDHKTISLKIKSDEGTTGISISILVNEYTDAFHYKILTDSMLYNHEKVKFIYISDNYYESVDGNLLIYSDDDKTIRGEFEFTAQNVYNSNDIINITEGNIEIDYSESVAIERNY